MLGKGNACADKNISRIDATIRYKTITYRWASDIHSSELMLEKGKAGALARTSGVHRQTDLWVAEVLMLKKPSS